MFWARINDVYMAEYDEAGPGMRGVEQILVSVVSISKTREFAMYYTFFLQATPFFQNRTNY